MSVAGTLVSVLLAAMPQATGDITTMSAITDAHGGARASGGITAERDEPIHRPRKIVARGTPRQVLADWRGCRASRLLYRCASDRRVAAGGRRYRVRAVYVARRDSTRTTTTVRVERLPRR